MICQDKSWPTRKVSTRLGKKEDLIGVSNCESAVGWPIESVSANALIVVSGDSADDVLSGRAQHWITKDLDD